MQIKKYIIKKGKHFVSGRTTLYHPAIIELEDPLTQEQSCVLEEVEVSEKPDKIVEQEKTPLQKELDVELEKAMKPKRKKSKK